MRANRLLSILMLLQTHGQLNARELAAELEVTERTIYRDIEALSTAGVPIYSMPGRGGGYGLVDSYRTTLTGLTQDEVRALFMLNIPAPLTELGVGADLQTALRKLSAAVPTLRRSDERQARQRFYFDAIWWQQGSARAPHLQIIYTAVLQDRQLDIAYRPPFTSRIARRVAPYGLVAKAGIWYLVSALSNGALQVQRVSEFLDVTLTAATFERPSTFDLARFWEEWCDEHEALLAQFTAVVRVSPPFIPMLPYTFSTNMRAATAETMPDGSLQITLTFESFEAARDRLLGCGRGVEVLEPAALRHSIRDYAEQIIALYGESNFSF